MQPGRQPFYDPQKFWSSPQSEVYFHNLFIDEGSIQKYISERTFHWNLSQSFATISSQYLKAVPLQIRVTAQDNEALWAIYENPHERALLEKILSGVLVDSGNGLELIRSEGKQGSLIIITLIGITSSWLAAHTTVLQAAAAALGMYKPAKELAKDASKLSKKLKEDVKRICDETVLAIKKFFYDRHIEAEVEVVPA